jgi:hypothetical protein
MRPRACGSGIEQMPLSMQRISDTGTLVSILVPCSGSNTAQALDGASSFFIAPAAEVSLTSWRTVRRTNACWVACGNAPANEIQPEHSCNTERFARVRDACE